MNAFSRRLLAWSLLLGSILLHVSHCEWDTKWSRDRLALFPHGIFDGQLWVDHRRPTDPDRWEAVRWGIVAPLLLLAGGLTLLFARTDEERRKKELYRRFLAETPDAASGMTLQESRLAFSEWKARREEAERSTTEPANEPPSTTPSNETKGT